MAWKYAFSLFKHFYVFYRKIHILGSFQNIKMARTALCNLILGKLLLFLKAFDQ